MALGLLALTLGEDAVLADAGVLARLGLSRHDARTLLQMARRGVNTAWTSSMGRLFDAVAALLLGAGEVSHEGEAAAWLEAAADPTVTDAYECRSARRERHRRRRPHGPARGLAADGGPSWPTWHRRGLPGRHLRPVPQHPGRVGRRRGGRATAPGCRPRRRLFPESPPHGGARIEAIRETGARVYGPGSIPPGDGGLAAGQLAVAMSVLTRRESRADNR